MRKQVDKRVVDIINKVPDNYTLANEILKKLKNNSTKVKLDNDIKNSYYVFVNDTIYLASNKKANEDYSRLCLIAHECWHSIQSKLIQKINFILSNIELVLFIICAVILLLKLNYIIIPIIYTLVVLLSLLIRFVLSVFPVILQNSSPVRFMWLYFLLFSRFGKMGTGITSKSFLSVIFEKYSAINFAR